jgi:hypothetical protein
MAEATEDDADRMAKQQEADQRPDQFQDVHGRRLPGRRRLMSKAP